MPSRELHQILVYVEIALGVVTFIALSFIVAPYGRHGRAGWGPRIPARLGWMIMESPALWAFWLFFEEGRHRYDRAPLVLAGLWTLHYLQRVVVFPLRMKPGQKSMPIVVMVLAIVFNVLNASVNAPWLSAFGHYDDAWLADPRFIVGTILFIGGWLMNMKADAALANLRKPGETAYRIPNDALHSLVASPNYLGEVIEWSGFAIATWSLAGLSFALYTAANLVPRAIANLAWYRKTFPDYPKDRRAIIPWLL